MEEEILNIYKSTEWKYEDYKKLALDSKEDIKAIRAEVYNELDSDPDLGLVNDPSKAALWNLFADIFAFVAYILHKLWTIYEQRLKTAAKAVIPHTPYWYALQAKKFQLGDNLDATNGTVEYPVIDEAKQIITASAVKESGGTLILKVAKAGAGGLVPLTSAELLAFKGYVRSFKDAGVNTLIVSQNPDLLKLELSIYYNPIIPLATLKTNVEAAIVNYVNNLPFDGIFRRTKLVDAIQAVEGIEDVKINTCEATVSYTNSPSFTPVDVFYESIAGYMNIDSNYPLSSGLNFIANV